MKQKRIKWNEAERIAVLDAAVMLYQEPERASLAQIWFEAQELAMLPKERRRGYCSRDTAVFHKQIKARLAAEAAASAAASMPAAAADAPQGSASADELPHSTPAADALASDSAQPQRQLGVGDMLVEMAIEALKNSRVKRAVLDLVAEHYHVEAPKPEALEPSNVVALRPRPRLPKVMVVASLAGRLRAQLNGLFRDRLELYFWSTDRAIQELKERATRCDIVVIQTTNISHNAYHVVKARAPSYIEVNGGMGALEKALEELVPAELRKEAL